jgi:hypothetical protein
MIESIFHVFKEFFEAIFKIYYGEYDQLQFATSFKNFSLDILRVIRNLLFIFIIFIIAEQSLFFYEYLIEHLNEGLSVNWIVLISIITTVPAYYFSNVGIKRIERALHIEKFFLEHNKLLIDKIYTQTLSIGNKISKNYQVSFSFFASVANAQNNYEKFIELLQKTTSIQPQKLTNIAKIAKKSTCGHFMCVIAYLDFFKNEKEFKSMINYFSKYEVVASLKKNIVQRVFTIPGIPKADPNDICYQTFWINDDDKINNYYLLCYLVLNNICACEAYLLIYDQSKKNLLSDCFLVDVDYVLAFKNENEATEDNIELFFAYPEEGDLNRTLKIKDDYFIRMFELDFQKRMELDPTDETPTTLYKFNKRNYNNILQMLHINPDDNADKDNLNIMLDNLKILLKKNQLFNQLAINSIDEWKK